MKNWHVEVLMNTGADGPEIRIRNARIEDARRIQVLYGEVYGSNYSLPVVYERNLMRKAIQSDNYFWLVGEHNGRIIGSLLYSLDKTQRLAKAIGAVVSREYRKHNLANTMMKIILDKITKDEPVIDVAYATTRTVTTAPQQMTENLGFVPLGIFPNAHTVWEHETHCLAGYFVPEVWKKRKTPIRIIKEIEPFYSLVRKSLSAKGLHLGEPRIVEPKSPLCAGQRASSGVPEQSLINFETITAPHFVQNRFAKLGNAGMFANSYVPFHEPNLALISHDQKTEVYLHYAEKDKYTVILGGRTEAGDYSYFFNSIAVALNRFNVSYIELLIDAYSPELQWHALNSRFLPSAYFPAMRNSGGKRWDYIVFSRSFDMLDFRNVTLISTYKEFLKEYLKVWRELYVDQAFQNNRKN